jgi:hypothetical protein
VDWFVGDLRLNLIISDLLNFFLSLKFTLCLRHGAINCQLVDDLVISELVRLFQMRGQRQLLSKPANFDVRIRDITSMAEQAEEVGDLQVDRVLVGVFVSRSSKGLITEHTLKRSLIRVGPCVVVQQMRLRKAFLAA